MQNNKALNKPIAYIGIDPGASGAICILVPETKYTEFVPTTDKPMDIIKWLLDISNTYDPRIIMIENVHAIQGTSAGSNFKFGYNTGVVNALAEASGIGVDKITPKMWQKTIGVKAKGKAIKKEVASIAERLYPQAEIRGARGGVLDGRSDALMIAHVTYLKYNQNHYAN